MIEMNKQLVLKAALILFLSTGPSIACDPEEMINELRAQCRDGIASVAALIEPLQPQLTISERSSVESKIKEATALCNADKYTDGYTVSAKLARFVGHLEAQKGIFPVL
jgi:hypothetical protein